MPIILVTGGNRGIGYAIAQLAGTRMPNTTILVGCRSPATASEPIQKLQQMGVDATFEPLELDITGDSSINSAVRKVEEKYGRLDVLINNAGAVELPKSEDLEDIRANWSQGLDCIFTSHVLVTKAFLPLLRRSDWGRVIMNSSARGSLGRNRSLDLPPSVNWMYDCSKAALNLATIEFRNEEIRHFPQASDQITFWTVSPGHCRTGFNDFRGTKDPLEGAEAAVRLLESKRGAIPSGTFWEFEYGNFQQVPW